MNKIHEQVKTYYGETLQSSDDLKTNACCTINKPPKHILKALHLLSDEVKDTYYGCGLTLPNAVKGLKILDLGSGSGRDCFLASYLVSENGQVIGVDMTDNQLEIANRNVDFHTKAFSYTKPNVRFLKGNIEALSELNLAAESFDLIISNCVINLATNKQKVLNDAYNLLKPGGEMYFSDVYSDRRIPKSLKTNKVLWGECLSGALYWNDFLHLAKKAGFTDPRAYSDAPITIENEDLQALVGDIKFYSVTYRLMKIADLEPDCEDYGQAVTYKGEIMESPHGFKLDDHHYFPMGKIIPVCGNTFKMLHDTRFQKYFDFHGTWDTHFGVFEGCGENMPFGELADVTDPSCC